MKISYASILISLIGLVLIVKGQYDLGQQYIMADGKTQALYGLLTLGELPYIGFGIIGLILGIVALFKGENKKLTFSAISFAILTIPLPISGLWQLMTW